MRPLWLALVLAWAGSAAASGDVLRSLATRGPVAALVEAQDDRLVLQLHHAGAHPVHVRFSATIRCAADAVHVEFEGTLRPGDRARRPWPACSAAVPVRVLRFSVTREALADLTQAPEHRPVSLGLEPALGAGLWGVRVAGGPSTLFKSAGLSYPETGWLFAPAIGATFDTRLTPLLGLRALAEVGVGGASLDAGSAGTGHVELWALKLAALFTLRFGAPTRAVRPFLQLGPYGTAHLLTRAELNGYAIDADPSAPYRAVGWGLLTGAGLFFEAWGHRWSVDLRLDTALRSLANPEYPAFARTPDETLRATDVQLGLSWHW